MNITQEHIELYEAVRDHYGTIPQVLRCVEELAEFLEVREISRSLDENYISEFVDVEITVEQMALLFQVDMGYHPVLHPSGVYPFAKLQHILLKSLDNRVENSLVQECIQQVISHLEAIRPNLPQTLCQQAREFKLTRLGQRIGLDKSF